MVRMTALQGIAMLGQGLPSELTRGLSDPNPAVRLQAIQAIATMSGTKRMDGSRASAEKRLGEFLEREKDISLNLWAHAAIITLHKKVTAQEFSPIVKRVNSKEPAPVRMLALQLIGMTGPEGKPMAIKEVIETVHDAEIPVGVAAINCLVSMQAWETKPMLKKIVDDKMSNDVLHDAALTALNAFAQQEKFIEEMKAKEKSKDKKSEK
jgi:hypothetical protein